MSTAPRTASDWDNTFESWANPPSATEQTKCDNSVTAIRKAIAASSILNNKTMRIFAQGSYCNRTNVKQNSDVDVCVLCRDTIFFDLPAGKVAADFGISVPATYQYPGYKNDVEQALSDWFGAKNVARGNKAFDIHENTYRIDADAVAAFEYRRYQDDGSYHEGVAFMPDNGDRVINWPQQNYDNGVAKNTATSGKFKDTVRIIKRLQIAMEEDDIDAAKSIPSFLIECLVWNVPDNYFEHDSYNAIVHETLAHLFNSTINPNDCTEWGEINELKYLFYSRQSWTMEQVHDFISAAWDYLGFE